MSEETIRHFTPGDRVEALDPSTNQWRPATVMQDAPYHRAHCGGAYIAWELPADAPMYVSRGGWQSERSIREDRRHEEG